MSPKKNTRKSAKSTTGTGKKFKGFTDEERLAMKERIQELKGADGESSVLAKIAAMSEPDRAMGKRLHAIIKASAPALLPRLWYGMPAYAKEGKVICFFKAASKYKERYASFGFDQAADLEEGTMWPSAWFLTRLTPADEKLIATLVKKAVR